MAYYTIEGKRKNSVNYVSLEANYVYRLNRTDPQTQKKYLKCTLKDCRGSAVIENHHFIFKNEHNHPPISVGEISAKKIVASIKTDAENSANSAREVFDRHIRFAF